MRKLMAMAANNVIMAANEKRKAGWRMCGLKA
jgi:hypothetical protein